MPSVHTLKGIITSVSRYANTILADLNERFTRKDIVSYIQELSEFTVRPQDIGRTISVIDQQSQSWDRMRFAPRKGILRSGYGEVKFPGKKRYSTVIESRVENIRTGEKSTRHIKILHDEPATREALEQEAENMLLESEVSPNLKVLTQMPVQGFVYRPRKR
ncbi:hypothetical protein LCGC14_0908050 [marine sediment metagenome]|uniref:Uncharacterized protein n=1 Tax=marine sediment metagenome TaxID=412755 RepID=A0A0F9S191_9ZZZZ